MCLKKWLPHWIYKCVYWQNIEQTVKSICFQINLLQFLEKITVLSHTLDQTAFIDVTSWLSYWQIFTPKLGFYLFYKPFTLLICFSQNKKTFPKIDNPLWFTYIRMRSVRSLISVKNKESFYSFSGASQCFCFRSGLPISEPPASEIRDHTHKHSYSRSDESFSILASAQIPAEFRIIDEATLF